MKLQTSVLLLCGATLLLGQPRIVIDPQRPELDTLDFGTTFVGWAVLRSVTILNFSQDTVLLAAPVQPYFSIERLPGQGEDSYDYLEFEPQTIFPVVVPPWQTQRIWIRFRAYPELYPLGLKQASLLLGLRTPHAPAIIAADTFVLRAFKTELQAEFLPPLLAADSVFVGAQKPLQLTLQLSLTPPPPTAIDTFVRIRLETRYRSYPIGAELQIDSTELLVPARSLQLGLRLRYCPQDPGPDTIEVRCLYRPYPVASNERSAIALITGFGVVHHWHWEIQDASPGVQLRGDTISFGNVRIGGTAFVRLQLRNEGNYRYHAQDTLLPLTPEANGAFLAVPTPFPPVGIRPQEELQVELVFWPHTAGLAEATYVLTSDLGSRSFGVPWSARQWHLVLRGVGIGPRLQLSPRVLELWFPWSSRCPRVQEHRLQLGNTGTDVLKIDTAWLATGQAISLQTLSLPLLLHPGERTELRALVQPPSAGEFRDTLYVRTNVPGRPLVSVPIRLLAVAPIPVSLHLPVLRAKPGSRIWLRLEVDTIPENAHQCQLVLSYDPSLLRWETWRTEGTALEGAQIARIGELQPGVLSVHAYQPYGSLRHRSTLLELGFRVFLGRRMSTEVSLQRGLLGDTLCPEFWTLSAAGGRVMLDSVCGLEAKLLPEGSLRLELFPNPSADMVEVVYELPVEGPVELALFNAAGMHVATLYHGWRRAGIHVERYSLRSLPPGYYHCRLHFGDVVQTHPLIVEW
ncbi:MAG: hypothetical protein NZ960_02165 [Candidatus Kapabacteria bacterium]|nr:hypothetical protein [Candidatus Kapabacteria bacterium]MDW8011828.1 hypothetical protein [Bacteroidota bacterium]